MFFRNERVASFLTCSVDILSVPSPVASAGDAFKVLVDLETLESGIVGTGFALGKLRFKLPTLSSKGRCADPLASVDLA